MPHQTTPPRVVCVVQLKALFSIAPFTTASLSPSALVLAFRYHSSALMRATTASRAFLSSERRRVISAASSSPSVLPHRHPISSPFAVPRQAPLTLTLSSLRSRTLPALWFTGPSQATPLLYLWSPTARSTRHFCLGLLPTAKPVPALPVLSAAAGPLSPHLPHFVTAAPQILRTRSIAF